MLIAIGASHFIFVKLNYNNMVRHNDIVNSINRRYVKVSARLVKKYEKAYGLPCDLYFPQHDYYNEYSMYRDMKIFGPHQSYTYNELPDVRKTYFYIPHLIKKEGMNSSELEFDAFFLEEEIDRPFIETTKKRELPIGTKVVVYQGESISKFFVDKKTVVTGADGFMLLRMYLDPLAKDSDEDNITEDQEEIVCEIDEEEECSCDCDEHEGEEDCNCNCEDDGNYIMNIPDEDCE